MSLRFFEGFLKIILCVAGAVLLYMIFERNGPWYLSNIVVKNVSRDLFEFTPDFVEFRFPFLGTFKSDYYNFIWLSGLLLPAIAFLFRSVRSSAAHLLRNKSALCFFSLSLIFFCITFFPGFFLTEKTDPAQMPVCSAALYVTLGLYGVCFFFTGISGFIADWSLWSRLRACFLTIKLPWFLAGLFLIEFLCTNLISFYAFEHRPHIQDSFAQFFHGTIFAHGHLTALPPPLAELNYEHIISTDKWYSQYPPGHSFLLMLGILAGAPWIVNPLLGTLTIVLLYFLGRELYGDAVGRVASFLGLLSPFILFMSSEFMNNVTALFLFTVFMLFYARTVRLQSILSALVAGAALGWIINIRPMSAATLALPFMVYACWLLVKRFKQYWLPFLALSSVTLIFIGILLAFNWQTNGDPFLFGYEVLYGKEVLPGFGHSGWGHPHTMESGIRYTLNNFVGLNKYLFEWPIPSLAFVFILFAAGRVNRWDVILFSSFFCLALGYLFYWYQDWCFGPRFLYDASGCIILLTVRGFQSVPHLIKKVFGRSTPDKRIKGLTTAVIVLCIAYTLSSNVPALYQLYSNDYWETQGSRLGMPTQRNVKEIIILMLTGQYL